MEEVRGMTGREICVNTVLVYVILKILIPPTSMAPIEYIQVLLLGSKKVCQLFLQHFKRSI